jgi:hypothetical protein
MKLTTHDITYIVRKFQPKTVEEYADFGLKLIPCGSGASRNAYRLRGYGLVVKIPFDAGSSKRHALQEMTAYRRILKSKKYIKLRKYLPKIHCCTKDGIILMDYYKKCSFGKKDDKEIRVVRNLSCYLFPDNEDGTDMYGENLGRDKQGGLHILDFGCFFSW